jgi:hypothetical protein
MLILLCVVGALLATILFGTIIVGGLLYVAAYIYSIRRLKLNPDISADL